MYELKIDNGNSVATVDISSQMNVYPNPADNQITVSLQTSGAKTGAIYNIAGIQVMNLEFSNDRCDLNISHLPKGIYLMRINTPQGQAVKKFVKH